MLVSTASSMDLNHPGTRIIIGGIKRNHQLATNIISLLDPKQVPPREITALSLPSFRKGSEGIFCLKYVDKKDKILAGLMKLIVVLESSTAKSPDSLLISMVIPTEHLEINDLIYISPLIFASSGYNNGIEIIKLQE